MVYLSVTKRPVNQQLSIAYCCCCCCLPIFIREISHSRSFSVSLSLSHFSSLLFSNSHDIHYCWRMIPKMVFAAGVSHVSILEFMLLKFTLSIWSTQFAQQHTQTSVVKQGNHTLRTYITLSTNVEHVQYSSWIIIMIMWAQSAHFSIHIFYIYWFFFHMDSTSKHLE